MAAAASSSGIGKDASARWAGGGGGDGEGDGNGDGDWTTRLGLGNGEAGGVAAARCCGSAHETISSVMSMAAVHRKLKTKTSEPIVDGVDSFSADLLEAAKREREVKLTTVGRKSGKPHQVIIWTSTDGRHLYIRSGQGLRRNWPQNLVARGEGVLQIGNTEVRVKPRQVTDSAEARTVSGLYKSKYGPFVRASRPNQPLTPGEQATFELLPASS